MNFSLSRFWFAGYQSMTTPVAPLETPRRLSESILWKLQRAYFESRGVAAFGDGEVPHYITNNPRLATSCAGIALGLVRDLAARGETRLEILEPGAGSGRFAHAFLRAFFERLERSPHADFSVRYILSDFTEANVRFAESHPALEPFVKTGRLDFAIFDAERDDRLTLRKSGAVLAPESPPGNLLVIANYFFDSLPSDLFAINEGRLQELHAALEIPTQPDAAPDAASLDPAWLMQASLRYEHAAALRPCYPAEPELETLLEQYARQLDDTTLSLPVASLRCLSRLHALAGGRLIVLSADKGYARLEDLEERSLPSLSQHGSVSLMVNYHAIGEWVRLRGGAVLRPPFRHASLDISAASFSPDAGREFTAAFREYAEALNPDDFYQIKTALEPQFAALTLPQTLAYLRLSAADPRIFRQCYATLLAHAEEADDFELEEIDQLAHAVWSAYYHIGETEDIAFMLGLLHATCLAYEAAIQRFRDSLTLYGPSAATLFNLGACLYETEDFSGACKTLRKALDLEPDLPEARALLSEAQARLDFDAR